MTPPDLFFVLCLFGFLSWLSPPISERRTKAKPAARTKAKTVKRTKSKKPKKQKRTKARKEKRYNPPVLSVEDQIRYDQYKLKQSGATWNSGDFL